MPRSIRLASSLTAVVVVGALAAPTFAGPVGAKAKAADASVRSADGGAGAKTGSLESFPGLQSPGAATTSWGFSAGARPFIVDERNPAGYTRDLLVSDVGVIVIGGVAYREFLADVDEGDDSGRHDDELLPLDKLMAFESASGMQSGFPALGTLIWDLDAGGIDRWVKLDYSVNGGGSGEESVYVPDTVVSGLDYVDLYSRGGARSWVDGEIEEWLARETSRRNVVPEPSLLVLLGAGAAAAAIRRRRLLS